MDAVRCVVHSIMDCHAPHVREAVCAAGKDSVFKRAVSVTLQTLLLLAAFLLGSLLPALGKLPMWRVALSPTRFLVLDGLALMSIAFVLLAALELAAKRLRSTWPLSVLALLLALGLGLAMKFPFMGS